MQVEKKRAEQGGVEAVVVVVVVAAVAEAEAMEAVTAPHWV